MWRFLSFLVVFAVSTKGQGTLTTVQDACRASPSDCVSIPTDCLSNTTVPCDALALVKFDSDYGHYGFQIATTVVDGYVALGFSDDQSMGDDAVVECVVLDGKQVNIQPAYNSGHKPVNADTTKSIDQIGEGNVDGLYCHFQIVEDWETPVANVSMTNNEYYLLLAYGTVANNSISHHTKATASKEKFQFNSATSAILTISSLLSIVVSQLL